MADNDRIEEAILKRIQDNEPDIRSKDDAIAAAKHRGWLKQKGRSLAVTNKGMQHARQIGRKKG